MLNTNQNTISTNIALHAQAQHLADNLKVQLKNLLVGVTCSNGDIVLKTTTKQIRALTAVLRNRTTLRLAALIEIAATDKLEQKGRFSVAYCFLSGQFNQRVVVELIVDETTGIPSLASPFLNFRRVFSSAGWLEREVWDLFGIYFIENGDLRRILTDYGFTGHPLRKDFPLTGFHELVYNDARGVIVHEPVELSQEFRIFHL